MFSASWEFKASVSYGIALRTGTKRSSLQDLGFKIKSQVLTIPAFIQSHSSGVSEESRAVVGSPLVACRHLSAPIKNQMHWHNLHGFQVEACCFLPPKCLFMTTLRAVSIQCCPVAAFQPAVSWERLEMWQATSQHSRALGHKMKSNYLINEALCYLSWKFRRNFCFLCSWKYVHKMDSAGIPTLNSALAVKQRSQCIFHLFIGEAEVS